MGAEATSQVPEKVKVATPQKAEVASPQSTKVPSAVMRYLYSQAARRMQSMEKSTSGSDYEAARLVVKHLVTNGLQRAQEMRSSMPDALAEAQQDIAAIRASKKRIEDATKKAEEIVNAASTKVQAAARGRQVRQKKDLLEKSAVTLQRALRRLQQQWHEGKKWDFAAVVRAVKGQRREWAMEFQRVAGEGGLDQQAFVHALSRACSGRVSSLQARQFEAELFNAIARLAYSCRDDDVSQDTWARGEPWGGICQKVCLTEVRKANAIKRNPKLLIYS